MGQTVGRTAFILYKGGVLGEEALDDHSTGEPLKVLLGDMQVPKGVENAILEMEVGEQKTVQIPAELGYGEYQEQLASWYPRAMLNNGYGLKSGDLLFRMSEETHQRMPAWVTETTEDAVRIDFNHPFAGKTLEYWIHLVDVK